MFIKTSLLCVLNASAVQSPIPGSRESLKLVEILCLLDLSLRCRRRFGSTLARLVQVRQRRQTRADRRKGALGYSAASRKVRNRRVPLRHSRLPQLDDYAE